MGIGKAITSTPQTAVKEPTCGGWWKEDCDDDDAADGDDDDYDDDADDDDYDDPTSFPRIVWTGKSP